MRDGSQVRQIRTKQGSIEYQEFYAARAKNIADSRDIALGSQWGLSEGDLDYLINFEIKYRIGDVEEQD